MLRPYRWRIMILAYKREAGAVGDARQSAWIIEKREAEAEQGMVAAMHPLAAAAGLEVLQAGGNAVDAAVATAFAIGVVEPFMSGVGGVAAMVVYQASTGRTFVVDGSSGAPTAARPDTFELAPASEQAGMYGWRATAGDAQNTGYRAPVVSGTPACLLHGLERLGSGKLSRGRVMESAIRLAEEGFPVDPYVAQSIAFAVRKLQVCPESMRVLFQPDGTPYTPASLTKEADRLAQPDLARTLRLLAEQGADALYHGEIGERIVADLQANGGLLTTDDFASYRVRETSPGFVQTYREWALAGLSELSGSATAFQALNILECFDLGSYEPGSPDALHLVAEACRRAFLDRFVHLADPACEPVPLEGLLSKEYAARLAEQIDLARAEPDARPGNPWAFQPGGLSAPIRGGAGAEGCTTHLTVVDRERNVVSLTSTLGESFGSGVVARGTGILLNNGMTWFDPEPGKINSIRPGKRTLWAPTPTIALRDGRPFVALGAPGGRRIISAVVQSLVNALDFGLGIQAAVSAPRLHCEGPRTDAEARLGPGILAELERRGHRVRVIDEDTTSFRFARPNGIRVDPATGGLSGGVNQYMPAWALGY